MRYTQEQIDQAKQVNLVDWLKSQGESLEKSGGEYRWKRHDSVTIRENHWCRHSQQVGGNPIDFIMHFYGATFPEAVQRLTGANPTQEHTESRTSTETQKEFRLPKPCDTSAQVQHYLTETRCIAPEILNPFLSDGTVYEDARYHNAIFVGRDENGIPAYAHARGTTEHFRRDISGSRKEYGFSHEGSDHVLAVFEAPIDLLSFLTLRPENWTNHSYLALGGVSDKALLKFLERRSDIETVCLCLDSDEAGITSTARLAKVIPHHIKVYCFRPVLKDWNEVLQHRSEIEGPLYQTLTLQHEKEVPILRMSDVETQEVQWLWRPYIPFGKVTIIQGNPGEGKTTFALRLAAACTTGTTIPAMEPLPPFNVIYQTAEDGLGDTIKPRLEEAGADLERVLVIDESGKELSLSDDRLEKAIVENQARLLILDPIQAYLGAGVDINRANEIRPVFRKLGDICSRTGCAIVLIGHLNKAGGTQSAYRGLGSIDFRAAVRSVLLIGRVRDDPTVRVICHDKSSLAPEGKSIAFSLGDEKGFKWIGEYDITADDLLCGRSGNTESKKELAVSLILSMVSSGKEVSDEELVKAGADAGISERTLREGKAILKERQQLVSRRVGKSWFHSLKKTQEEEPDWTDPMQRIAKTAEIMGWNIVDVTDQVQIEGTVLDVQDAEAAE